MQNEEKIRNQVEVTFSQDETEAFLCLTPEDDGASYTVDILRSYLKDSGVTTGIMDDVLRDMIEKKTYHQPVLVASGKEVQDGQDGWFEFLFDTDVSTRPKILKDGSVDYTPCGNVPSVQEGQKLVIYHPASQPKDGLTVLGDVMAAKRGKELARLRGKGFIISDDGIEYIARYSGKVTYHDNWLNIDKELTIEGDVSYTTTGSISFQGDIHIRGNVLVGMSVTSERGGIVVDGYVEAASLQARKDIVLKNGMQGNGKGCVQCDASVSGKFFERTDITCKGDVCANAIMNCNIDSESDIKVSGRFGIIVGGRVHAIRSVRAMIIGNSAQKETVIQAGLPGDLFSGLSRCEKKQNSLQAEVEDILEKLKKVNAILQAGERDDLKKLKIQLTRMKVEKDSQINEVISEKQNLVEQMAKINEAKVTVEKTVYPGTQISVNGMRVAVQEEICHVEYARRGSGIISYNIED